MGAPISEMPTEPIFSYAAAPHPVKPRNKFRSIGDEAGLTLMSDPRVRRGLTLKSTAQGAAARGEGASVSPQSPARSTGARHAAQADRHAGPSQPTYSFEVAGFSGSEFNLDQYLVASDELKNNNQNESCQTDEFVPLPPPAAYVPRKTGVDTYSQVEHQHELFDFNSEVKPVVDVIVKKTIEQALFELSSEEELKTLQSEINKFNIERETEARWIHLKEQETIEDNKFKERERSGRVRLLAEECAVRRRVAAAEAMRQLIPGLLDAAARDLLREKVWKDEGKELASAAVVPLIVASAGHAAELYAAAAGMVEGECLRRPRAP